MTQQPKREPLEKTCTGCGLTFYTLWEKDAEGKWLKFNDKEMTKPHRHEPKRGGGSWTPKIPEEMEFVPVNDINVINAMLKKGYQPFGTSLEGCKIEINGKTCLAMVKYKFTQPPATAQPAPSTTSTTGTASTPTISTKGICKNCGKGILPSDIMHEFELTDHSKLQFCDPCWQKKING